VLRRATRNPRPRATARRVVEVMDLTVDLGARTVLVGGEPVALTTKEFDLLAILVGRVGHAVSRRMIIDALWDRPTTATVSRTLNVHMTKLRAKLRRPQLVHTLHGYGYRLGPPSEH
jgi:DNA-binding response OmpR family regulator